MLNTSLTKYYLLHHTIDFNLSSPSMLRSRFSSQWPAAMRYNTIPQAASSRTLASTSEAHSTSIEPTNTPPSPRKFFKITLLRSAISLGSRKKGTLESLGIHRRMQTVFHPHSPEFAGKILAVKELVRVENVEAGAVRTKTEQRRERKAPRGFKVVGDLNSSGLA